MRKYWLIDTTCERQLACVSDGGGGVHLQILTLLWSSQTRYLESTHTHTQAQGAKACVDPSLLVQSKSENEADQKKNKWKSGQQRKQNQSLTHKNVDFT